MVPREALLGAAAAMKMDTAPTETSPVIVRPQPQRRTVAQAIQYAQENLQPDCNPYPQPHPTAVLDGIPSQIVHNWEEREAGDGSDCPYQVHPLHTEPVRHPWEEEHGEDPVQNPSEGHDGSDQWGVKPEPTYQDGCGEEYGQQGTERYVDHREEGVVGGGDDHIPREKVT